MKSLQHSPRLSTSFDHSDGNFSPVELDRRGSVLLVVIGMLGILLLAGIAFYTFASQENSSAEYYSSASKVPPEPKMVADALFDFALEQLIIGPHEGLTQSALRGGRIEPTAGNIQIPGRHSLLAGAIGHDGTLFNGEGIKLGADPTGYPFVDMNQDGTADNPNYLNLNFSAGANGGTAPNLTNYPGLDTGYTAPDINSPYLAYFGTAIDNSAPTPTEYAVSMPSFLRPQYLRGGVAGLTAAGNGARVLRPHPDHLCKSGTRPRFLIAATAHPTLAGHTVAGFPMTANPNGTAISQGLWDLTAPAPAPGSPLITPYNWDVDNNGDGVREGIWMDLDHPVVELADGRKAVPMFSFTVMDADGLMNLNASGNASAWLPPNNPNGPPVTYPAGSTAYVHRSNMALTRSEINPQWGLYADGSLDPGVNSTYFASAALRDRALEQYRVYWNMQSGSYNSSVLNYVHTSNMDFLSLLNGRADFVQAPAPTGTYILDTNPYAPLRYLAGRHGDATLLNSTIAPSGATNTVLATGSIPKAGVMSGDDDADNTNTNGNNPAYYTMGHPIDYLGYGSSYRLDGGTSAITQMLVGSATDPLNPIRWPAYNGYENMSSNVSYQSANSSALFLNGQTSAAGAMTDEEDESVSEPNDSRFSSNDSMFETGEMFGLHGSDSDFASAATGSRLRDLAPFNFSLSTQAPAIRSQYTTLSMDRFQFGAGLNANRYANEVNADLDSDGILEFPPVTLGTNGLNALEPIRLAVRKQITVEYGSGGLNSGTGFKLNMNQVMDLDNAGNPVPRDLTDHPSGDPGAMDLVPVPFNSRFTSPAAQEYWARRDRQVLARDIYVLLYLLGGGNDATAYSTTSNAGNAIYSNQQLQEMAQFAVNYVDAMDNDRVMTKFEYDKNLADGWNLDDDAYTDDEASMAIPAGDRAITYGIELQSLTFSEAIVVYASKVNTDQTSITTYDDSDDTIKRYYTAIELRNASPYGEDLSYRSWRIRILEPAVPLNERTLTFYSGAVNGGDVVQPGAQFTIGSRSGTDTNTGPSGGPRPSDFRVNYDHDTEGSVSFNTIIPSNSSGVAIADTADDITTTYDLDLVRHDGMSRFDLGGFSTGDLISNAGTNVTFVIERRANLFRDSTATAADNPWIEVDRMDVPVRTFSLTAGATGMDLVDNLLPPLTSRERPEPFAKSDEGICNRTAAGTTHLQNTIGMTKNQNATDPFVRWQPHFDRPYTSSLDLLSLPIVRPAALTTQLGDGVNWGSNPAFAQEKFLRPVHPLNVPTPTNPDLDNHWHRLLDFLTIPNRTQTAVNTLPASKRTPGLINLNTIRHRGVFAGLVDDYSLQFGPADTNASNPQTFTGHFGGFNSTDLRSMTVDTLPDGTAGGTRRDWYGEFIRSRDGQDPLTQLFLPGMAHSRPFRGLNYTDSYGSVEHTILRGLHKDGAVVNRRGVFEASRNYNDKADDPAVDLHTRHRLLRKVANNSTTRSNVFVVWVSVGFFEAIQHTNGDVQVGGPLTGDGTPTHRGFFVIDRSLPETALDLTNGRFDMKRFIPYRKTIR